MRVEETIDIRRATPDDADALAALTDEFNSTVTSSADVRKRFAQTSGHEFVYIAVEEGRPVGFACAQIYRSICYERPMAEVTEIYVRNAYRTRGIGHALLARAEADMRAAEVTEVRIETDSANGTAVRLYSSAGYETRDHRILRKGLGQEG